MEEVSVILENLSFSTLVDPFRRNGISGKSFNYIDSYTDIMGLDKAGINKVVARTFYENYVLNWKASNSIPKKLLLQISSTTSNLKVCMSVRMFVCAYLHPPIILHSIRRVLFSHFFLSCLYIQQGGGISSNSKQAASSVVRVFIRHILRYRLSYILVAIVW